MNFEDIETAREEKDIGVTFRQDLKFSSRIAEKINRVNSILSLIVRTFDYIEKERLLYSPMDTNPLLGHMWKMGTLYGTPS